MKSSKVITGCALAAGLMAFAPQSQAGLVISNSVVSSLNIKATVSYVTSKNKVQKATYSNKDILKYDGAPKGATLAMWEGDIVIISNKAIWDDLTADGILFNDGNDLSNNTVDGKNGAYKYSEVGTTELAYYSDGDTTSIDANTYGFDVTGTYTYSESGSAVNKGAVTFSDNFQTSTMTGTAYDNSIGYDLPATATMSGSGSGKVLVP